MPTPGEEKLAQFAAMLEDQPPTEGAPMPVVPERIKMTGGPKKQEKEGFAAHWLKKANTAYEKLPFEQKLMVPLIAANPGAAAGIAAAAGAAGHVKNEIGAIGRGYDEFGPAGAIGAAIDPVLKPMGLGTFADPKGTHNPVKTAAPLDLVGAGSDAGVKAEPTLEQGGLRALPGKGPLSAAGGIGGGAGMGGGGGGGGGGGAPGGAAAAYMAQIQGQMPDLAAQESRIRDAMAAEQEGLAGVAMQQYAAAREHEARLAGLEAHARDRQKLMGKYENAFNMATKQLIEHPELDEKRWWNKKSTGEKIGTIVGGLFSAIGMGLSGHPELAAKNIEDQINLDIELQKASYAKAKDRQGAIMSAWDQARHQANSDDQAEYLLRAAALDKVKADVEARMGEVNMGKARVGMEQFLYNLQERRQQALEEAMLRFMAKRGGGGGVGGGGFPADGSDMVTFKPGQGLKYGDKTYIIGNESEYKSLAESGAELGKVTGAIDRLTGKGGLLGKLDAAGLGTKADLWALGRRSHPFQTELAAEVRQESAALFAAMRQFAKTGVALNPDETANVNNLISATENMMAQNPAKAATLLKNTANTFKEMYARNLNAVSSDQVNTREVQRRIHPKSGETMYYGRVATDDSPAQAAPRVAPPPTKPLVK